MTDEVDFKGQYADLVNNMKDVCLAISALPDEGKQELLADAQKIVADLGALYDKYTDLLQ